MCSVELRLIDIYHTYFLKVYVGDLSRHFEALSVEASKQTTAEEIVSCIVERLGLPVSKQQIPLLPIQLNPIYPIYTPSLITGQQL